ncbi:hypothetical protein [Brevifollis gellanilyticus]|uniref:Uncharacterized protein n=1 Tax=Brevifollis gellanilyticus TaxID=748831 RepID=A0A512M974_9BACT|nr:hypothetical protein [Brevifollis gellanilyticus]GEP43298.1 hypothetical protein BGE01nite_25890 [Brevifollis gellanilyticus]
MSLIHRCLIPVALAAIVSCQSLPTAPEPIEFSYDAAKLKSEYKTSRQFGIATLHASSIRTDRDAQGNPTYLATGGALLVKDSVPAIIATAPEIFLNANEAELRGISVVKKGGLLYQATTETSKIFIDGVFLRFEGHHLVRQAGGPARSSEESSFVRVTPPPSAAPVPTGQPSAFTVAPLPQSRPQEAPKPRSAQPKRTTPKPAASKPKPAAPKPAATAAPKPAAPVDRAKVLQLMREPE